MIKTFDEYNNHLDESFGNVKRGKIEPQIAKRISGFTDNGAKSEEVLLLFKSGKTSVILRGDDLTLLNKVQKLLSNSDIEILIGDVI